ncbi:TetR/AcrR family transcriptional regulator [Peribacillus muralis]|uniref:TetR/AcrR family transcriptional regulator n=1 Tax=Peribacillus muralis TaxID=264697 RepID=UPI001F4DB151|nr:TetR/AcrR family transcriptional regulator [Peribacillus muralis]MCK1992380.1 TetR/AcrR family transcriptional regulator [Peribacillus muralis]MCK2012936.1 TetR/AcrR family transcriptional regulator [Peribacillus muralis]
MMLNEEKRDITSNKIVKVAHSLFMENGYRAVSTREIADVCGLTQPTLYHHFKNKKALYLEVLRTELYEMQIALERIIRRYDDLEQCLYQVTYYILINKPSSISQMFRDIEIEMEDQHRKQIKKWWIDAYQTPIASIFEKGIKEAKLRNPAEFGTFPVPSAYLLLNLISTKGPEQGESEKHAKVQAKLYTSVLLYGMSFPEIRD